MAAPIIEAQPGEQVCWAPGCPRAARTLRTLCYHHEKAENRPVVKCRECGTELREPAAYCRFCSIELGHEEAA